MRITQEADYATRIVIYLSQNRGKVGSAVISEDTVVPHRFTFKILRKLTQAKITESIRGKGGGYRLAQEPEDISLLQVIETIDGPIQINKCLDNKYDCSLHTSRNCKLHNVVSSVSTMIEDELGKVSIRDLME